MANPDVEFDIVVGKHVWLMDDFGHQALAHADSAHGVLDGSLHIGAVYMESTGELVADGIYRGERRKGGKWSS